jgi:hypothetical protein
VYLKIEHGQSQTAQYTVQIHMHTFDAFFTAMGRAATLSLAKRIVIVTLKEEGYSSRAIAQRIGVSQSSVVKVCSRQLHHNTVQPVKPPGRPRKTTPQTDRLIRRLCVFNPLITSREVAAQVCSAPSARTIRRRLKNDFCLSAYRPARKPFLNKR